MHGLDNSIGYYLSLSRIIVFLPFFVLGFYIKSNVDLTTYKQKIKKIWKYVLSFILFLGTIFIITYIWKNCASWSSTFLYGSYSYESAGYGIKFRLIQYIVSLFFIISLLWFIPNRKFIFSYIGKYTISIYLFHGFIIKILVKEAVKFSDSNYMLLFEVFIITILLIISLPLISIIKEKIITRYMSRGHKSNG